MVPKTEIELLLKNIKIDIPVINIPPIDHFALFNRRNVIKERYLKQSEEKKKLPLSRFWKSPDSLQERCSQLIASEIVINDFYYNRALIPQPINDLIDQKLERINDGIDFEEMVAKINKERHEQKVDFLNSLNDKSWLRPS